MEEQESAEQKSADKASLIEPVFGLMEWLTKVSVPLGAMLLTIAALYWVEFIKLYALPVDFSSSGALSGLPVLAAVIAALVGVLALSAIAPALALVYPINSDGATLIQEHLKGASKAKELRWGGDLRYRFSKLHQRYGARCRYCRTRQKAMHAGSPTLIRNMCHGFSIYMSLAFALLH